MKSFFSTLVVSVTFFAVPKLAAAQNIVVDTVMDGVGNCDIPGQCTLKAALRQSEFTPEFDTILLKNARYVLDIADPVGNDLAGAVIRDDVMIAGHAGGGTVIEAVGLERAIEVVADANVILSDLKIELSEQAVRCEGSDAGAIALVNTTFEKNDQAVEASGCSLWVSNSLFHNNGDADPVDLGRPGLWENPLGNSPAGAGIYIVDSGQLFVTDTTFSKNFAAEGGAIYSDNTDIDISGGSFTDNFAYAGGAIGVAGTAITVGDEQPLDVSIHDTDFSHNQALYRGGAIHSLVRTTVDEAVFHDNRVIASLAPFTGNIVGGGAIFSFTADITNSQFQANYVQGQPRNNLAQAMGIEPEQVDNQGITFAYLGGAIGFETIDAFLEPGHEDERDSRITQTLFVGNYIEFEGDEPVGNDLFAGGGAVSGNINSLFISNEQGASLQIDRSILAQNRVETYTGEQTSFGGGIALSHGEVTDTWLTQNESVAGAGVACWNCNELHVASSTFNTNTAERAAGIFVRWVDRWQDIPATATPVPLRVENSTFTMNSATRNVVAQRSFPIRAGLKLEPEIRSSTFVSNDSNKDSLFGITPATLAANIFQDNKVGGCNLESISAGFNVFDTPDPCVELALGDLVETYANVAALSFFNGGHTPTHALDQDSPAVGLVPQQWCLDEDQRGVDRPNGGCDAGSFEHWDL